MLKINRIQERESPPCQARTKAYMAVMMANVVSAYMRTSWAYQAWKAETAISAVAMMATRGFATRRASRYMATSAALLASAESRRIATVDGPKINQTCNRR